MPIYEYTCRACGESFEHWHSSMSDTTPVACPQCEGVDVQKRISAPAVRSAGAARDASGASAGPTGDAPAKPEVFGRKELNSALRGRGEKPAKE